MDNENDIIRELTETTARSKSNTHQINEMKNDIREVKEKNDAIYQIATSVQLIAQDVGYIKDDIKEVKNKQNDLNDKQNDLKSEFSREIADIKVEPLKKKAKFLEGTANKIIAIIITGIVTFILGVIAPVIFK